MEIVVGQELADITRCRPHGGHHGQQANRKQLRPSGGPGFQRERFALGRRHQHRQDQQDHAIAQPVVGDQDKRQRHGNPREPDAKRDWALTGPALSHRGQQSNPVHEHGPKGAGHPRDGFSRSIREIAAELLFHVEAEAHRGRQAPAIAVTQLLACQRIDGHQGLTGGLTNQGGIRLMEDQ